MESSLPGPVSSNFLPGFTEPSLGFLPHASLRGIATSSAEKRDAALVIRGFGETIPDSSRVPSAGTGSPVCALICRHSHLHPQSRALQGGVEGLGPALMLDLPWDDHQAEKRGESVWVTLGCAAGGPFALGTNNPDSADVCRAFSCATGVLWRLEGFDLIT